MMYIKKVKMIREDQKKQKKKLQKLNSLFINLGIGALTLHCGVSVWTDQLTEAGLRRGKL